MVAFNQQATRAAIMPIYSRNVQR